MCLPSVLAAVALGTAVNGQLGSRLLDVEIEPGESWYGAATDFGQDVPFGSKTTSKCFDLRSSNYSNQTAPLLLSSRGRYVWSDKAFACTLTNGTLHFEGDAPLSLASGGKTLRDAFRAASRAHFPASGRLPDPALFEKPQWNTWVELTYNQNQRDILAYARAIRENGFPEGGVLMIDDTWQYGYGVWEFDPRRFSDPKAMTDELHSLGYKVMLWICPFVSMDSPGYREMAFGLLDAGRRVKKGGLICATAEGPKPFKWWNGKSAHVDFTHPRGAAWFARQLKRLQTDFGVDGFKLDAGDVSVYEAPYDTHKTASPSELCEAYARIGLGFPLNEYRACFKMAGQPLVQRLSDKNHDWRAVASLVPDMIQCGLLGHPFVCPDMIGSGSWMAFMPDAPTPYDPELFVRSAQVHALAPMMQFSAAPWRLLKGEHLEAVRSAVWLRMRFTPYILKVARHSAKSGEPMLRSMEYAWPGNGWESVTDQFMLGDDLLVAPQVVKGARSRTVAIPPGEWKDDTGAVVKGPCTVDVRTPLSRLPHFVRMESLPPRAPGPEAWTFRAELAAMPTNMPPRVGDGRTPWVKDRISRCFFSPIRRPPFNRDELLDDIDYYPEGYLARLANEGVNGLWLSVRFRDLVTCPYYPADPQAPKRLAKLRRTVEKCARYGIKIWLFAIEPVSMADDDPFLTAHPEIAGPRSWDGRRVSCLSSAVTLDYLRAATRDIFTRVPGLGGLIQITSGERPTTCFSEWTPCSSVAGACPRCGRRSPAELHAALTGALAAGMREANPEARFISWFYHPDKRPERAPWVADCARNLPDGVTQQYNFESGCSREQVSKLRHGGDYWLSVPGPAAPFKTVASAARSSGRALGAKIQVACSHEVATVPYVPVPGLLYRKYRAMHEEGVESVMQCWFFGNCPGVMNRAAGELSFSDFSEDEEAFLLRLAAAEWGSDAVAVAGLWKRFSDAYSQYPLSNLLQYYGPFHASVMATLLPDISLVSQARTWKPNEIPSGDLIGEALKDFTLEEALVQTKLMCAPLESLMLDATLAALEKKYAGDRDRLRDLGVMKALKILFVGARDVFAYYLARREGVFASRTRGDFVAALAETAKMGTILSRAETMTREMMVLCADDSRLGFHSEAEAHLFNVEMLDWRMCALMRSRQRLDAIERELCAKRPWPVSSREREAEVWEAKQTVAGEIVIEGIAPADSGDMEVRTYDLCGTRSAQVTTGTADAEGRFRILLPKPSDDPRFRPAWIVIRRGGDFNNGGTTWIWPKRPEFPEPRLEQSRLTGDNFARIEVLR